jgi:uncharacterized protein (TIGR03435 family)
MCERPGFLIAAGLLALSVHAQDAVKRPSFEVASIRLNADNGRYDCVPQRSGNRVFLHNTELYCMVNYAYHFTIPSSELVQELRLPSGWNWYDVEAETAGPTSDSNLRLMFQSLLEERFKLKLHREMREMQSFDLVVARDGSRLKTAVPDSQVGIGGKSIPDHSATTGGRPDGIHLLGKAATTEQLATALSRQLHIPIVDRTKIAGEYDFDVIFSQDDSIDSNALSVDAALRKELGLHLESKKQPIEMLVVDHVEKPAEN